MRRRASFPLCHIDIEIDIDIDIDTYTDTDTGVASSGRTLQTGVLFSDTLYYLPAASHAHSSEIRLAK